MANGQIVTGFQDVSITRSCESLPNSFSLTLSAFDPASFALVDVEAGDPCTITIGGEPVLTGYVEEDGNEAEPGSHALPITGAGRSCDLVECSVIGPAGGFVNGMSVLNLAQLLASDYGITVSLAPGANGGQIIPGFAIQYGDTAAQILDHVCRAAQLLCYEQPDGSLLLSSVGTVRAASGVVYAGNAQRWSVRNSMAERFSEVRIVQLSLDGMVTQGAPLAAAATASDPNVPRKRVLFTNGEGLDGEHCKMKAQWMVNRAAGRGTILRATVDSWRDAAGTLWAPNTILACQGPGLRLGGADSGGWTDLCISSVTYSLSADGHTASIEAMPPSAFTPEVLQLQPQLRAVNRNDGSGLEPLQ